MGGRPVPKVRQLLPGGSDLDQVRVSGGSRPDCLELRYCDAKQLPKPGLVQEVAGDVGSRRTGPA